jgi:hypothetical protein
MALKSSPENAHPGTVFACEDDALLDEVIDVGNSVI